MLSKDEIIENFELASVACDRAIQYLRSQQIKDDDARLSFYFKLRTLFNMFRLSYGFYEKYLLTCKYWGDNHPDFIMSNKNMNKLCDEYDMFVRSIFITELYSAFESSIRVIAQIIQSEFYGKNKHSFNRIAKKMLEDLQLTEEYSIIRHFSILRNTLHSNGIFDPLDGKNQTIQYKGKIFSYVAGKPVEYAGWEDLLSISKLIHFLFLGIIHSAKVQSITHIKEPASEFFQD